MFYEANNDEIASKLIGIIECMQNEFLTPFCQSAICSPKDFWRIINLFCKGFDQCEDASSELFGKWLCFAKEFAIVLTNKSNSESDAQQRKRTSNDEDSFVFDLFC